MHLLPSQVDGVSHPSRPPSFPSTTSPVSMDAPTPIPDDIARIAGPLLIGYLLDWGLFGVLSMQVYIYYLAFPRDPIVNRGLVYGVYLLMLVQTILLSQSSFKTFAAGFGDLAAIDDIAQIWFSVPIMSAMVALAVQTYYALQILVMSKDKRISFVIVFLAVTQLVGGILTGVIGHGAIRFSKLFDREAYIAAGIWNGAGALCDIIIMACMSYYYMSPKSKYKPKPARIPILISVAIQSGGLVATIAIINTAFCLLSGQTYFQTTSGILGNTYANTLMALLNSRVRLARPSGFIDDEVTETYLNDPEGMPVRSALVFKPFTTEGEMTMAEWEADSREGERRRSAGRSTDATAMTTTDETRTNGSLNVDGWDESASTPKDSTPIHVEEV